MTDKSTIAAYNTSALDYDAETKLFWERFPRHFLDEFIRLSRGPIFDLGCGPGRDGLLLKQAGRQVVGVDISPAMTRLAQCRSIPTIQANFTALPIRPASLGAIWAYTSLVHLPKRQLSGALTEIRRVLRRGGILGLGMIEGTGEGFRTSGGMNLPRWFSYYTGYELQTYLAQHGFGLIVTSTIKPGKHQYLNILAKQTD